MNAEEIEALVGKTILVVDDTPTNFMLIKTALRSILLKKKKKKNGLEAIEICDTDPNIELVLMDIRMPVMDGYEASERIRKIRPDLPIIAQTSYAMQGDKEQSLMAGCTDYISKPLNLDNLKAIITKYLNT